MSDIICKRVDDNEEFVITGSGGGGKGGGGSARSAQEAPNTLRSSASIHIVEVISEGEIDGFVGGAQAIRFNDTPILQADGVTWNFQRVTADSRVGLPSQPYMRGFSAAEAEIAVGVNVTVAGGPVVKTTSATNIDAVKVTIQLPQGLYVQNTSNGDLTGSEVIFNIETKLTSSGNWQDATGWQYQYQGVWYPGVVISGKTTSPYERQYRISRPYGTNSGSWDIRVTRKSGDDASAAAHTAIRWSRITEIQEIQDTSTEYDNTAVIGLVVDSESVGNQIPVRSYLVQGIKVQVPTNYNGHAHTYSGTWNGTFKTEWSNNPAWILYDLLTNTRYGMGEFIPASRIDKFSFYDAAVYNDGIVSDGNGGNEWRYTFNGVIAARDDAYRILQTIAGSMRAQLVDFNGMLSILQDRPLSPVKLISKANVIGGNFDYKSSGLFERHTAFNVTYNDSTDRYLQRVVTIDASTQSGAFGAALAAAQAKFGYNPVDIAAYGCTSEAQALRHGRWAVDTEINQTEIVQFKMSLNGFDLLPGDIVKVYDEDYTATVGAGRIVSASGTLVTVDRQIDFGAAPGGTFEVTLNDGTIESHSLLTTNGISDTFNLSSSLVGTVLPGAEYILTTTAAPRQFKILAIKQEAENTINIEAVFHDPNKFSRVETGISVPARIFSNAAVTVCSEPTNLVFKESAVNVDNTIKRSLLISWMPPTTGIATYYTVQYRLNSGAWKTESPLHTTVLDLPNINDGVYEVNVYAHTSFGIQSQPISGSYTILTAANGVSVLNAPTSLIEKNVGGSTFYSTDLSFKWTNPTANGSVYTSNLRDFCVKIYDTVSSTPFRIFFVDAVAPGATQSATYTWTMNNADTNNVPNRSIKVEVYCRDTSGNLSAPVTTTFNNPICALPSSITVVGGLQTTRLTFTLPTEVDFKGVMVWGSTSSGFTPSSANLLYDGTDSYIAFNALSDSTTYYYKVGSYDSFGKSATGNGMNVSTQYSATTAAGAGVPKGATNPTVGMVEGDVFFNTTDGQLYRYHAAAWTLAVPAVNVTGTLTDAQLAAIGAAKITGQITTTQITDSSITTAKVAAGAITASQIAADTITAGQIAANAITASELNAGAVTTTKIAAGAVTANEIAANTITAGKIAAATITSSEIAAGTIAASNIAAGTITGDRIASGTVTATNIDSRNLTIKDAAGTVIFSSGVPLTSANITPASGWLNSNIAVSGGALTGIGTGAGTVVDNSLVPATLGAGNQLANSDFSTGRCDEWIFAWLQNGVLTDAIGPVINDGGTPWHPDNGNVISGHRVGTTAATTGVFDIRYNKNISVIPGGRYQFSAYVASHRSNLTLCVWCYKIVAGVETYITESDIANTVTGNGGTSLSNYERLGEFVTLPSDCTYVRVGLRSGPASAADPYFWATKLYFGQAGVNQTVFSPWSASGAFGALSSVDQLNSGNISTYIANAAIGTAQVGTLNASVITSGTITTDRIVVGAVSTKATLTVSTTTIGGSAVHTIDTASPFYVGSYFSSGTPIKTIGRVHVTVYSDTLIDNVSFYFTLRTDTATSGAGQIYYHSSRHKAYLQSTNYYAIVVDIPIVLMFSKSGPVDIYMTAGCGFFAAAAGYVYPTTSNLTIQPDIIMEENKV